MPKYRNRFAGHLTTDDPRTIVSGAGGCAWPTIPPYRVLFHSVDATGEWGWLRHSPILLQQDVLASRHDYVIWTPVEMPWPIYQVLLEKFYNKNIHPNYDYYLTIHLVDWPSVRVWQIRLSGKCNRDVLWGRRHRRLMDGNTGKTFRQYQVEHDKTRPPGWDGP